jgi:hypothetical protein
MSAWQTLPDEPQTFASFVSECAECGAEVSMIVGDQLHEPRLSPCGHKPSIKLVPNPRLRVPPATP